jgi:SAM-dependent methyltransferase
MPVRVNLGCGDQRLPGHIGLDILIRTGTDVICDLNVSIPLAPSSVEHIRATSILEHIDELERLLKEVSRVLSPDGTFYVSVPHWTNPLYYSDYSHRRFFGLATFDYFAEPEDQTYRKVPVYTEIRFQVVSTRLIFWSPFRLLHWLMNGFQWFVNRGAAPQLFYEYHLSSLVPCYAIEYVLRLKGKSLDA